MVNRIILLLTAISVGFVIIIGALNKPVAKPAVQMSKEFRCVHSNVISFAGNA